MITQLPKKNNQPDHDHQGQPMLKPARSGENFPYPSGCRQYKNMGKVNRVGNITQLVKNGRESDVALPFKYHYSVKDQGGGRAEKQHSIPSSDGALDRIIEVQDDQGGNVKA